MSSALATELAAQVRGLERDGPRRYSRWSSRAWQQACAGPAAALWDALAGHPDATRVLGAYLLCVQEAVGLQLLSVTREGALDTQASFMAAALCELLPRTLPKSDAKAALSGLCAIWNAGERLAAKPLWLNRYLALRAQELTELSAIEAFLQRVLVTELSASQTSAWSGPVTWTVLDLKLADSAMVPGAMHLATPSMLCVHDRERHDACVAVLLRPAALGGPLGLGRSPCLRDTLAAQALDSAPRVVTASRPAALHSDLHSQLHLRSGYSLHALVLSQRLWVAHSP